ncbi:MAG: aminoglycoside phosphotransferase family protein [Myxococcota bacterium]
MSLSPPSLPTLSVHLARRGDVDFWRPYIVDIFDRHGLGEPGNLSAGFNPTHPTFLAQDVVIKLFGGAPFWKQSHLAEQIAQQRVSDVSGLKVPRLVARGNLCEGDTPWPYLITTRVEGGFWDPDAMSPGDNLTIAEALGRQLHLIHQLDQDGIVHAEDWGGPEPIAALQDSGFPQHLLEQVDGFLERLDAPGAAFLHGDLVANHIFVRDGKLAGIIDWGDAMIADPHAEIAKLHFHTFGADRRLLRQFLEGYGWPVGDDFPQKVLGCAIRRQQVGLAQHHSFDIFNRLPALLPLGEIDTIDALAERLFGDLLDQASRGGAHHNRNRL